MSIQGPDDDRERREVEGDSPPAVDFDLDEIEPPSTGDLELDEMWQRPVEEVEEIAADDDNPLQEKARRVQREATRGISDVLAGLQPTLDAFNRTNRIREQLTALQPKIKAPVLPQFKVPELTKFKVPVLPQVTLPEDRFPEASEHRFPELSAISAVRSQSESMIEAMEEAQAAAAEIRQRQEKAQQDQIALLGAMLESTLELVKQHKEGEEQASQREQQATRHARIGIALAVVFGIGGMVIGVLGLGS